MELVDHHLVKMASLIILRYYTFREAKATKVIHYFIIILKSEILSKLGLLSKWVS